MFECLACGSKSARNMERYFVVPGHIMVPNCYLLCDEHKHLNFTFEDVYNNDGSRKAITLKENV